MLETNRFWSQDVNPSDRLIVVYYRKTTDGVISEDYRRRNIGRLRNVRGNVSHGSASMQIHWDRLP